MKIRLKKILTVKIVFLSVSFFLFFNFHPNCIPEALVRLKGTGGVCANETQFVKTACLPDGQLPDGMECKISGWGATEDCKATYILSHNKSQLLLQNFWLSVIFFQLLSAAPNGSAHLLDANVMLINQEKCSEPKIYGTVLDNSMLCAGHLLGGVDSCQVNSSIEVISFKIPACLILCVLAI